LESNPKQVKNILLTSSVDATNPKKSKDPGIMEGGKDFASLPREMALKIFDLLSIEELKICVQVSRAWWDIGSSPTLWKNLRLHINERRLEEIATIFQTQRFSKVSKVQFVQVELENSHLELVAASPSLTWLEVSSCSLEKVWPEVLTACVASLTSLSLSPRPTSPLSSPQKLQLFFRLSEPGCCLEEVSLSFTTLEEVPPRLLATALVRVNRIRLRGNRLSKLQAIALLDSVQFEEMRELALTKNNLSLVPAVRLQELPLHSLTRLEFTHCSLGALHLLPLFASLATPSSSIRHLLLRAAPLSSVPSAHMAAAVDNLETVSMVDCRITDSQAEQTFEVLRENVSLKEVDLSQNRLSTVKPAVLARVVNRLVKANLSHCSLTRGQVQKLLQESLINSQLTLLNIRGNDLQVSQPQLLEKNGVLDLVHRPHDLSTYGIGVSW